MYAGADGNVYKKTDSGWQKYDNGSWNSVDKPTSPSQRTSAQSAPAAASERTGSLQGAQSDGRLSQLESDRSARMTGGMRQQQFQSMRGGGGFAGRGGGGFRR